VKLSKTGAFAAGVVATLVIGSGTAVAANGKGFVLGRSNHATATSTLTNGKGTPLKLNAKKGSAPLAVNSNTRVPNLNADRLDGIDGSGVALTAGRTGTIRAADTDRDGAATATCPPGTRLTGGGGLSMAGYLEYSGPDFYRPETSWTVTDYMSAGQDGIYAFAVCYNPRGAVPGAIKASDFQAMQAQAAASRAAKAARR
jgi:hypothetical protein